MMDSSNMEIQLLFCKPCGSQRVCDVTKELQTLFTAKYLEPNTCGICQRHVELKHDANIDIKKSEQSGKKRQSEDSDGENEDYGLDDSCDHGDQKDNELSNVRSVVRKQTRDIKKVIKYPTKSKAVFKTSKVAIEEQAIKQEDTRVTRLRTGTITTRKYTDTCMQDDESSNDHHKESDESNFEDDVSVGQDADGTDMESDQGETIDVKGEEIDKEGEEIDEKEVKEMMKMEEDPELVVASAALSKETDENPVKHLDPEILDFTLPSDNPERPLTCKVCNTKFGSVGLFVNHVSDHTGKGPMKKPLRCSDCGKNFSTRKFKQHRSRHLKLKTPQRCTYKGCKFMFKDRAVFRSHLDVHEGAKHHCCKVCGAGFSRKNNLSIHAQTHRKRAKQFLCRYCKKPFDKRFRAWEHERKTHNHHENLPCDDCGLLCSSQYNLDRHKVSHKKEWTLVCSKCRESFPDQDRLDQHAKSNTCKALDGIDWEEVTKFVDPRLVELMDKPRIRDKPFRCKQCPTKEFKVAPLFLNHMKYKHPQIDCPVTHVYTCNQCDKKCKTLEKLTIHNVSHSLLRSHFCDYDGCNKAFKSLSHMKLHKQTHTHERRNNHICHICGAGLISNSKLNYHMVAVHCKDQPRPYKCSYCGKGFLEKGKMDYHIKLSHLKVKPFVCEVCGKSFKENHELVTHNYTHTGERPFACHLCEYRCTRRDYLKKHIRTHTREQPHKCELCETTFMHKTNLNDHMKKVHCKSEPRHTLAKFNETVGCVVNNPLVTSHETDRAVLHILPSTSSDTTAGKYSYYM